MCPDVLLFTKPECDKCNYVKTKIPENLDLQILDMTSRDGMAHATHHEILEKYTPILVVGEEVVEGAIRIKNKMREVAREQETA